PLVKERRASCRFRSWCLSRATRRASGSWLGTKPWPSRSAKGRLRRFDCFHTFGYFRIYHGPRTTMLGSRQLLQRIKKLGVRLTQRFQCGHTKWLSRDTPDKSTHNSVEVWDTKQVITIKQWLEIPAERLD